MPHTISNPGKDGHESSDSEPQPASGDEQSSPASVHQDSTEKNGVDPQAASGSSGEENKTNGERVEHSKVQSKASQAGNQVENQPKSLKEIASDVTLSRAAEMEESKSDSDSCCASTALVPVSNDDREENADILGAASQLLSVGVHMLMAIARDQPAADSQLQQQPPTEGTRLVHAVRDFLINPELLQPEQAAADIMREVKRRRSRSRWLCKVDAWLVTFVILMMGIAALFVYFLYTSYHMMFDRN